MGKRAELAPFTVRGEFWHTLEDGRVQCDLCPRACTAGCNLGCKVGKFAIDERAACPACGRRLAGHFEARAGGFGARRIRLPLHERA